MPSEKALGEKAFDVYRRYNIVFPRHVALENRFYLAGNRLSPRQFFAAAHAQRPQSVRSKAPQKDFEKTTTMKRTVRKGEQTIAGGCREGKLYKPTA